MSRPSVSQTPCSARNQTEAIESCGENCANLCRVYKLIMISRVPGYGHLEYLVPEYHVNLIMLLLINIVGLLMITFNWDRNDVNHSRCFNHHDSYIKFIPLQ